MALRGRVTVKKDGQLYVISVGGKEVFYRRTKAEANKKANAMRRAQGKAGR